MEGAYLLLVILLFSLAIVDLMVGVSNDAVNFLNSAIGSKVASLRTILIIASIGVFVGAVFSSGMMEVARKGIFKPSLFSMDEIMIIFLAVMITDILLLDFFNSVALPTSTTVSIVFELLGAALLLAIIKSSQNPELSALDYINTTKAQEIIVGIFLSVGIAFSVGALVQYLTRMWFSFNFEHYIPRFGWLFGGLAIAAIAYFVLIKGLKGSQFLAHDQLHWIQENTLLIVLMLFAGSGLILLLLHRVWKVHPLRMVVLAGTFSLAMAFAGNDLVNFIGVPITGFQTYQAWQANSETGTALSMAFLEEPIQTPSYLLVIAGAIMVLTLWFSGKARKVTETEVNLGRQDAGDERFRPNRLSRGIVSGSIALSRGVLKLIPNKLQSQIDQRFEKYVETDEENAPAFDLVRASANLMVASILIAFASSLKLPLSTTYVSFMVAMGTSLADQAWGRESAVFRVAGVLNVIGGWFLTAMTALLASGLAAWLFWLFGLPAILALFGLAAFLLIRSHLQFVRKKKAEVVEVAVAESQAVDRKRVLEATLEQSIQTLHELRKALRIGIREIPREKEELVKRVLALIQANTLNSRKKQKQSIRFIRKLQGDDLVAARLYWLVQDLLQDLGQSSELLLRECAEFLKNRHEPPNKEQMAVLLASEQELTEYLLKVEEALREQNTQHFSSLQLEKRAFVERTNQRLDDVLRWAHQRNANGKTLALSLTILMESKDIAAISLRLLKLYKENGLAQKE